MLVKYSGSNICTVKIPDSFEDVTFVPGNNEIKSEIWAGLLKNPNFKRRVDESGLFKVGKTEDTPDGGNPLADMGPAEAKQLVRETYDPELLRAWRSQETRKTVVAVIDEQLAIPDNRMAERKKAQKKEEDEGDE